MAAAMRTNHAATEAYFADDDNRLLNLEPFARKPDASASNAADFLCSILRACFNCTAATGQVKSCQV